MSEHSQGSDGSEVSGVVVVDDSDTSSLEIRPSNLVVELESDSESSSYSSQEEETDSEDYSSDEELANIRDDVTLAESISDEIRRGVYTCLVCTGEVDQESKVWSCHLCYRVYDLSCIRSWATRGSSTELDRSWRCPACNGKHHKIPKLYTCWCGKVQSPVTNPLNPHSCSNTCNHKLSTCSHGCSLSCHPGPHLKSCGAMGPVMSCHCGSHEQQLPCLMTPYQTGWQCQEICKDLMPCGEHKCPRRCHSGLCGPCKELVVGRCYCGKHEKEMYCHERVAKRSTSDPQNIGFYLCDEICSSPLDCGNHFCERSCHLQDSHEHRCPLNPQIAKTCHCGALKIETLIPGGRKSCLEPIPTCDNICGKKLPCGHECIWKCHEGECSPCYKQFTQKCSCHYSQFTVSCKFLQDGGVPKCKHKCQALLNCRRHRCNNICCLDEPVAMTRERERKKQIRKLMLSANEDQSMEIEAVHICTRDCGKLLSCGKHYCSNGCHSGPCPPCPEQILDDLVCSCGRTVVESPYRCGTKLPPCPFPCPRVPECGHPQIPHNCHEDDKECPKCTKLVTRECQCHRKIPVKNVMCFQSVVSCGNVCGERLPCGHKCLKTCHKPGDCLKKCLSKCNTARPCGHADLEPCHYPKECDIFKPCPTKVKIHCPCGRITKELACGATSTRESLKDTVLDCDEECLRVERNRVLFEALNIGTLKKENAKEPTTFLPDDIIDKLLELENPYPKEVLNIYQRQRTWCLSIENIFRNLLTSTEILKSTHHFAPMIKVQRQFIHQLAEVYKFYSQSQDQEPKRSVMIQKLQSSKAPLISLQEGFELYSKLKERERAKYEKLQLGVHELDSNTSPADIYFNAILVQDLFFGVTRDDIESALSDIFSLLKPTSQIIKPIQINFITDQSCVLHSSNHVQTTQKLENDLYLLMKKVGQRLRERSLLFTCKLCKLDQSGSVVYEIEGEGNSRDTVREEVVGNEETNESEQDTKQDAGVEKVKESVDNQEWW